MSFFSTRWSAALAWGMIPLAIWAGLPSTACVCANGQLKFVCGHVSGSGASSHSAPGHKSGCGPSCCESDAAIAEADSDHHADCCGGGFCCHDTAPGGSGIGSKACCKPILTAPGVAPEMASVSCDQAPAIVAAVEEIGAIVHPSAAVDVAEFDTGPPLDRIIVFRSLLI